MRRPLGERLQVIRMMDVYAALLTHRQQRLLHLYYHEDLSLAEIAVQFGVTRQAIHDSLKRSLIELRRLEDTLRVAQRGHRETRDAREPQDARQASGPRHTLSQERGAGTPQDALDARLKWIEDELTRLAQAIGDPMLAAMARRIRGLRGRP